MSAESQSSVVSPQSAVDSHSLQSAVDSTVGELDRSRWTQHPDCRTCDWRLWTDDFRLWLSTDDWRLQTADW